MFSQGSLNTNYNIDNNRRNKKSCTFKFTLMNESRTTANKYERDNNPPRRLGFEFHRNSQNA